MFRWLALGAYFSIVSSQFTACGTEQAVRFASPGPVTLSYQTGTDGGSAAVQFKIKVPLGNFAAVAFRASNDTLMKQLDILATDEKTDDIKDFQIVNTAAKPTAADMQQDGKFVSRNTIASDYEVTFTRLLSTGDANDFMMASGVAFNIAFATGVGEVFGDTWASHTARDKVDITLDACPPVTAAPAAMSTDVPTAMPGMPPAGIPFIASPVPQTPTPAGNITTPVPNTLVPAAGPQLPVVTPVPQTAAPVATPVPQTATPRGSSTTPVPDTGAPTSLPVTTQTDAPVATPVPQTATPPGSLTTPVPDTGAPTSLPVTTQTAAPVATPVPQTATPPGSSTTPVPDTGVPTSLPMAIQTATPTTSMPVATPVPQTATPPGSSTTPVPDTGAPTSLPVTTQTDAPVATPVPQTATPPGSSTTPVPDTGVPTSLPVTTQTAAPVATPVPQTATPPGSSTTPVPDTGVPTSLPMAIQTATPTTSMPVATPVPQTATPPGSSTTPVPDTGVPTSLPVTTQTAAPVATPVPQTATPPGSSTTPVPDTGVPTSLPMAIQTATPTTSMPVATPVPQTATPPGSSTTPVPDTGVPTSLPMTSPFVATPVPQTGTPPGSMATPVPNTSSPVRGPVNVITNSPSTPVPDTTAPAGSIATPVPNTPTPGVGTDAPLSTPIPGTSSPAGSTATPVPNTAAPTAQPLPDPPTAPLDSFVGCFNSEDVQTSIQGINVKYTVGIVMQNDVIMFEVSFPNSGAVNFAAVGFGSSGGSGMAGLDIYAFDSEAAFVRDFGLQVGNSAPTIQDSRQDGVFLSKESNSVQTTIKFYRKLDTGDVNDFKIVSKVPFSLAIATGEGGVFDSPMWTGHSQNRERVEITIDLTLASTCRQFTACIKPVKISDVPFFVQYVVGKDENKDDAIKFNIQVNITGNFWGAIGFSTAACQGCMTGLDIYGFDADALGVVDFQRATGNVAPLPDAQSDVNSVSWEVISGKASISFWRKVDTGDSNDFVFPFNKPFNLVTATGPGSIRTATWQKHTITPQIISDAQFIPCGDTDAPATQVPSNSPSTRAPAALCDSFPMSEIKLPGLKVSYSPGNEKMIQFDVEVNFASAMLNESEFTSVRIGFRSAGTSSDKHLFIQIQQNRIIDVGPSRKLVLNNTITETFTNGVFSSSFQVKYDDLKISAAIPLNVAVEINSGKSVTENFFTVIKPCYIDSSSVKVFFPKCGKSNQSNSDIFSWKVGTDAENKPTTEITTTLKDKSDYMLLKFGETNELTNSDAYLIYIYNNIPVVYDCYTTGKGVLIADVESQTTQDVTVTMFSDKTIVFQRLDSTGDGVNDRDLTASSYVSYEIGTLGTLPVSLSNIGVMKESNTMSFNQTIMCPAATESPTPAPVKDDDTGIILIIILVTIGVVLLLVGIGTFFYCRSKEKGLVDYDEFVTSMGEGGIDYQMGTKTEV